MAVPCLIRYKVKYPQEKLSKNEIMSGGQCLLFINGKNVEKMLGMVVHICDSNTQEAEIAMNSRPIWAL